MSPRVYKPEEWDYSVKTEEPEEATSNEEDSDKEDKVEPKNQSISDEVAVMLIKQLQSELSNHNLYRTFASYFSNKGFMRLSKYWKDRAKEEYTHSEWINNYLNECNVFFTYPAIPETKVEIENNITPFKAALDVEIKTTKDINSILEKARELKDYQTEAVLIGKEYEFGQLIQEQIEEEKLSRDTLNIASVEGADWLAIQDEIYDRYYSKV